MIKRSASDLADLHDVEKILGGVRPNHLPNISRPPGHAVTVLLVGLVRNLAHAVGASGPRP
eukprot:4351436-Pyramimonas_sp.AAC.1